MSASFEESCGRFCEFLIRNGYPGEIVWITSDDLLVTGRRLFYVRLPNPDRGRVDARARFEEAAKKQSGVSFRAMFETDHRSLCTVWVPIDDSEREREGEHPRQQYRSERESQEYIVAAILRCRPIGDRLAGTIVATLGLVSRRRHPPEKLIHWSAFALRPGRWLLVGPAPGRAPGDRRPAAFALAALAERGTLVAERFLLLLTIKQMTP